MAVTGANPHLSRTDEAAFHACGRWWLAGPRPYDRLVVAEARGGQALAARAAAWYSALSPRRREIVQDSALALGLAVLNLLSVLGQASAISGPVWLAMFLAAVQCLPLAFRRVNPVLVLICCGIPRNAYDILNFGYAPLPIANAIAFATVAYQVQARWLRWGTLIATAGGISWAMTLPGHPLPYEAIV